ncbi:MAG TPA: hypothetical protein VEJ86_05265 [Candidatus Binataceae bacterium]|nr:hypothetical protein [Candidatus Binataceae bacterium]
MRLPPKFAAIAALALLLFGCSEIHQPTIRSAVFGDQRLQCYGHNLPQECVAESAADLGCDRISEEILSCDG